MTGGSEKYGITCLDVIEMAGRPGFQEGEVFVEVDNVQVAKPVWEEALREAKLVDKGCVCQVDDPTRSLR